MVNDQDEDVSHLRRRAEAAEDKVVELTEQCETLLKSLNKANTINDGVLALLTHAASRIDDLLGSRSGVPETFEMPPVEMRRVRANVRHVGHASFVFVDELAECPDDCRSGWTDVWDDTAHEHYFVMEGSEGHSLCKRWNIYGLRVLTASPHHRVACPDCKDALNAMADPRT